MTSWKNSCGCAPRSESIIVVEIGPQGSDIPSDQQGIKVLGTPLGHVDFVAQHLRNVPEEQRCLWERIPMVEYVQSAWLLLFHCAAARANARSVPCTAVEWYAGSHDENIWQCLGRVLHVDLGLCSSFLEGLASAAPIN